MKPGRLHWWKSGSKSDVGRELRITLSYGVGRYDPEFAEANYGRAAFCYEHEARVTQRKRGRATPCYRFKLPFPELSQEQKDLLMKEFPPLGWKPQPYERSRRTVAPEKLADQPPPGWIDIHFWVKPSEMSRSQVMRTIGEFFDEEKRAMGDSKYPKIGRKPLAWKSLEVVDAFLNGTSQADHEKSYARLVLSRSY